MKKLRIYVDNSVVSGCFDEQFAEESNALMQMAREDKLVLVVCQLGQRAYDVQCALKGAGFREAKFLEAGLNVFARMQG